MVRRETKVSIVRSTLFSSSGILAQAQVVTASSPPTFRVSGSVSDDRGNPLDQAEIILLNDKTTLQTSTTGANGHFALGNFPAGNARVRVRRLGYQQIDTKIAIGPDAQPVDILLRELPQKLEEVLVKSDEDGRLREFAAHKSQRSNFGRYFDRVDIRKKNPSFASELFRTIPGAQVQSSSFGGNTIRIRGCRPLVWMDGQRVPGAELDEVIRPSEIAGLEIYSSNAGIPPEFMDRNNAACGIIVVWTKSN